jgi:hypothetical protein
MKSERLAGAWTANWTSCTVSDSPTNRAEVSEVFASIAKKYNLRDDMQQAQKRFESPAGPKPVIVAAYAADCPDTPKQPIWLTAQVIEGRIDVDLYHAKWHVARTATYTEIQEALESDFRDRLGVSSFRAYDELIK